GKSEQCFASGRQSPAARKPLRRKQQIAGLPALLNRPAGKSMYSRGKLFPVLQKTCYKSIMAKGKISAPTGHVNLRILAEHLGLSQTTVSLVLNDSPSAKSIPKETRERVVEAAKRLNYRPNYFARSLRRSKSMSVGVLAPDLSEG